MKKKIISCLCILAMMINLLPMTVVGAAAKKVVDLQKAELLVALGISDTTDEQTLSVADFIEMMSNLYQPDGHDVETFGNDMKMIDEGEDIKKPLTIAKAVKLAVITLGYRAMAEGCGGTADAYAKLAYDLEIADGISPTSDKNISFAEVVELVYAMFEATPMVQKYDLNNAPVFEVREDETILSLRQDVYTIEGVVTANGTTSIYEPDGCPENKVEIDMVEYENVNNIDCSDYLGKEVEAYVTETETGTAVLYMMVNDFAEFVIDAKDIIDVADGFEYIDYRNEEGTSKKRVKLEYPTKVIYNGRFYSDYTKLDLMPEIGELKLLDSDANGKYDIIFVESCVEFLVESRASTNKLLTSKLGYEGALESIMLEGPIERMYKIIKDGAEISYSNINIDDVLLIAESKDGRCATVYVSSEKIESTIQSWSEEEMEAEIDGNIYPLTNGLISQLAVEEKTVEFGEKYNFYINAKGAIAYVEAVQELNYYLYFKNYEDENDSSVTHIVYLDMNNQWCTSPTAKKIAWEDSRCDGDVLRTHLEGKRPQVAKMEFNGKGEVKSIEFATDTDVPNEDVFTRSSLKSGYYYSNQRTLDYNIFANDKAYVLEMPTVENAMDKTQYKWYALGDMFRNDKSYTVRAFDLDEFMFASIFTTERNDDNLASALSSDYFLVRNVSKAIVDEEEGVRISGYLGRFINYEMESKVPELYDQIQEGDLIRFHLDEKGYIDYTQTVISLGADTFTETWNLMNGSTKFISGTITNLDVAKKRIKFTSGGSERTLLLTGTSSVMIYEKASGDLTTGTFAELTIGDKIVINGSWHQIAAMYCVRD